MTENYLLMADVLEGIARALRRACHDPASGDAEVVRQLEKCVSLAEKLQREAAFLSCLSERRRQRYARRSVRASSMN